MQQRNRLLKSIALAAVVLAVNSAASAGSLPLENRLDTWADYGSSTVNFTNVDIKYTNGKTKKGQTTDTVFFGASNTSSQFELYSPEQGYGTGTQTEFVPFGSGLGFDGVLVIDARISSRGVLRAGSTFGIYSSDTTIFGSNNTTSYNCNKAGTRCDSGQLVYGGDLTQFGWSGSAGILEFEIGNLDGWALDNWAPYATREHIYLDVGAFTLNDVSSVKSFTATADGFAVVPVPAAIWLFGSGLLGLAGMARRKRS